jgi:hypothetical protein
MDENYATVKLAGTRELHMESDLTAVGRDSPTSSGSVAFLGLKHTKTRY